MPTPSSAAWLGVPGLEDRLGPVRLVLSGSAPLAPEVTVESATIGEASAPKATGAVLAISASAADLIGVKPRVSSMTTVIATGVPAAVAAVRMVQVAGSASPQAAGAEPDHASSPTGSALVPAPGPVLVSAPARVPVHRLHVVADVVAASYTYAIRFPSVPARVVRELLRQAALSGDRSWITSRRPLLRAIAAAQGFDDRTEAAVPCAPSETERLHS